VFVDLENPKSKSGSLLENPVGRVLLCYCTATVDLFPFFFVLLLVFCFAVILVIVVGEVINGIGDYGEV
jgi:hypothetical protein